jgi:hypothetical protein
MEDRATHPPARPGAGVTRAAVIAGAGAGAALLAIPLLADSKPSRAADAAILEYLILIERVQVAFEERAAEAGLASGALLTYLQRAAEQDRAHVDALAGLLPGPPPDEPELEFDEAMFASADTIADTAVALKDLALSAYNGQAQALTPEALATTVTLVAIDGRHAGWIKTLAKVPGVAPEATDPGRSEEQVRSALEGIGITIGGSP